MNLDTIPLWVLFAAAVLLILLSIEGGYFLGRRIHRRTEDEKESPVSAIAGTILVAEITVTPERGYGLAMLVLAVVAVIGLLAAALLPRTFTATAAT